MGRAPALRRDMMKERQRLLISAMVLASIVTPVIAIAQVGVGGSGSSSVGSVPSATPGTSPTPGTTPQPGTTTPTPPGTVGSPAVSPTPTPTLGAGSSTMGAPSRSSTGGLASPRAPLTQS